MRLKNSVVFIEQLHKILSVKNMADLKGCPFGQDNSDDCKNCDYGDINHFDIALRQCVKR